MMMIIHDDDDDDDDGSGDIVMIRRTTTTIKGLPSAQYVANVESRVQGMILPSCQV